MKRSYWEHKEAEEARRNEWRMLDEALRLRPGRPSWLRVRLGRALMALGANLAGLRCDAASSRP